MNISEKCDESFLSIKCLFDFRQLSMCSIVKKIKIRNIYVSITSCNIGSKIL